MDLQVIQDTLNFFINKSQGVFYDPEEIDQMLDNAQLSLYNDYYIKFATSQRLDDALAPFKTTYTFTNGTSPDGLVATPDDYLDLLDVYTIIMDATNTPRRRPCPVLAEDQITYRYNSQVIPMSVTDPFCNVVANWDIQLYPKVPQAGVITYLKRPVAPVFVYSLVSGRVIVYDQNASTQLEWGSKDCLSIIMKALSFAGCNISENDILQYAETKDQQNINTLDKL